MNEEQWESVKKFIRAYSGLQIDKMVLSAMLLRHQLRQTYPEDWHAEMLQMRELPLHRATRQELEELLTAIEKDRHDIDLLQLLHSLPVPSDKVQ